MTKAEQYLEKEINKFRGRIIGIGLSEELENKILNSSNITTYDFLYSTNSNSTEKYKTKKTKTKNINIRRFKKVFKKKRIDFIISNVSDINSYTKRFVSSSIYMCKDILYIYGNEDKYDIVQLINKYKRYKVNIIRKDYNDDSFVLKIDCSNAKNNKIKDIIYFVVDTINNIIDLLGDYLVN